MRSVLWVAVLAIFSTGWLFHSTPANTDCRLRVELIDAQTGKPVSGLIQIHNAQGERVKLETLLSRGLGLPAKSPIQDWSILTEATTINVPRERLHLRAFAGLESEYAEQVLDLSDQTAAKVRLKVHRFYDAHTQGYRNANTHVHLQKVSRQESDKYLVESATADGLDLVFVSYLERAEADSHYTSNHYSPKELHNLSTDHVHFGHGEEHRHNFGPGGEGYGHVMLLNIPELVYPVSIGPGISRVGTDGIPIKRGIERARELGGTIIWCHNKWGLEDIPNWLAGRLHANNIFDGGTHGSYRHSFYRYWDIGLRVPVSTGTDWFIYDFSRVYAKTDKNVTPEEWLKYLADCRSYITNGPLLDFYVEGQPIGGEVQLTAAKTVHIKARAKGRVNFEKLELVQNGKVVHTVAAKPQAGHFAAEMDYEIRVDQPGWLAVRTPPPSVPGIPDLERKTPLNEYGQELFSHTSPVFVTMKGRRPFRSSEADNLLKEMRDNRKFISEKGLFANEDEKQQVLEVYEEGIQELQKLMKAQE